MRTNHWLPVVGTFGLIAFLGCAVEEATVHDEEAAIVASNIQGGTVDKTSANVVGVLMYGQCACTGSLIAPNLVLTAQHCVAQSPQMVGESTKFGSVYPANMFSISTNYNATGSTYKVRKVEVGKVNGKAFGDDIAVLILSSNVPANIATPIVPRIGAPVINGETYTAIGFGETRLDQGDAGIRYTLGNLKVTCEGKTDTNCGSTSSRDLGAADWAGTKTSVWRGDSGGPALDSARQVIGVVSRGSGGSAPIYTGVHYWGTWLKTMAQQAATLGNYPAPAWATGSTGGGTTGGGSTGGASTGGTPNDSTGGTGENTGGTTAGAVTPENPENPKVGNGESCTSNDECESGICEEGVCKESDDQSLNMDDGSKSGSCSMSPRNTDPGKPVPWFAGLIGLAFFAIRRRRD